MKPKERSVSYKMAENHLAKVESRLDSWVTNRAGRITADLESYWTLLRLGLDQVYKTFTPDEARLIVDVQNPGFIDHNQLGMWIRGGLTLNVSDGIELVELDKKWNIDGPALVAKLESLGIAETAALLDWCRVMRHQSDSNEFWEEEFGRFVCK